MVVTVAVAALGWCAQDFQSQLNDLRDQETAATSDIPQMKSDITQIQKDNTQITSEIGQIRSDMAEIRSEVNQITRELSSNTGRSEGESTTTSDLPEPQVLPTETAPEPEPTSKHFGQAGLIGPEFIGERMACLDPQGDYPPYDPTKRTLAVAETLLSDLPCYSRVKVSRELEDGTTKTVEAIVADKFPDSDPDWKFNLSQATADALEITGRGTVTVELVVPPGGR